MKSGRLTYLDMAKGFGIIFVVLGHSQFLNEQVRIVITSFHMPLFFFVSGMLIFHIGEEQRPMREILRRKALSMLVPYAVFSAVYLAIYGGYYYAHLHIIEFNVIRGYLIQTFGLGGMSVLWFLTALFFSELAFFGLLKAFRKRHAAVIVVCVLCAVAAPLVKPQFDRLFPRTNVPLRLLYELIGTWLRSMVGLGFLLAGYELMRLFQRLDGYTLPKPVPQTLSKPVPQTLSKPVPQTLAWKKRVLFVCAGFCGLALTACLSLYNGLTDLHYMVFHHLWLYYLNAVLGTCSLIFICKYGKILRGICYLGANSLVIMATHLDCQYMLKAIDFGYFLVSISPRAKKYCLYFGIASSLLVMELVTIYVVNHLVPFVIGKGYPKRKKKNGAGE